MGTEESITAQDEQIAGTRTWVSPEISRLRAGSAELGDFANPDGNIAS